MQAGNESLGMLKIVQFGREIFTACPVAYVTVDFKKLVSGYISYWFRFGRKCMYLEKNEAMYSIV